MSSTIVLATFDTPCLAIVETALVATALAAANGTRNPARPPIAEAALSPNVSGIAHFVIPGAATPATPNVAISNPLQAATPKALNMPPSGSSGIASAYQSGASPA